MDGHSAKAMSDHHKTQLIDAFMYYCPMDVRGKLMREVPEAYNAYCGRDVVRVTRVCDGTEIKS